MKQLVIPILLSALAAAPARGQVEPNAGNWKTWIISSGRDYRVPPPPDNAGTQAELAWVAGVTSEKDPVIDSQVRYWNAGAPAYRWSDIVVNRYLNGQNLSAFPVRASTYVSLAIHDATIAAWESKYFYKRKRPSEVNLSIKTRIAVPDSPSYPSEFAAASFAAAEVLAYLVPSEARSFQLLAEEAGRSRLYAGVEYPSDYFAGQELGKRIAAEVIARARADGADAVFNGVIPTGPCRWTGTNPGNVTAANWKPLLLSSPSEFRPPAPPACDSPQVQAELAAVRNFPRAPSGPNFTTNAKAYFWQTLPGLVMWAHPYLSRWVLEDQLSPPQAARIYALFDASCFDSFIASQDGKYAYWYLRPAQLDPSLVPLFPAPNFPSYPSNHSTFSTQRAEVLAYLFPDRAALIRGLAEEAGFSRIWAGIHYQMDNQSGNDLGRKVALKFIDKAKAEGF